MSCFKASVLEDDIKCRQRLFIFFFFFCWSDRLFHDKIVREWRGNRNCSGWSFDWCQKCAEWVLKEQAELGMGGSGTRSWKGRKGRRRGRSSGGGGVMTLREPPAKRGGKKKKYSVGDQHMVVGGRWKEKRDRLSWRSEFKLQAVFRERAGMWLSMEMEMHWHTENQLLWDLYGLMKHLLLVFMMKVSREYMFHWFVMWMLKC